MKKLWLLVLCFSMAACDKVPSGNVGIKVHMLGGVKGVDIEELTPGRYWIGMNEELHLFPTFTQNYVWTKECVEGDCTNEEIGFQTVEGLAVKADVGISYAIEPNKAPAIFQKYRKGVEEITDLYLRNMVRDSLVKNASSIKVEAVYGAGKTALINKVQQDVSAQVKGLGINVEKIYWIGELRLPPVVTAAIDAKISATQKAQQRENEVAQAKAEALKVVEEANGRAQSRLVEAKAEAQAIELRGQALKNNPDLIELNAIEKWDGKLPVYSGQATPFINLPAAK
jgi:regulator of protease activity HflC (stomatin/prohibitin superfamily)